MDIMTERDMSVATRAFADRVEPRAAFWRELYRVGEEKVRGQKKVHVLSYYGMGGIGKSCLLKKLKEEIRTGMPEDVKEKLQTENPAMCLAAEEAPFFAEWKFEAAKDSRTVLGRLKNHLEDTYKIPFPLFDYAHYMYARKMGERPDSPEVKGIIGKSSFLSWCMSALDPIPVVGIASKLLQLADQGVALVQEHMKKHSATVYQIESMEVDDLYKTLPMLFAKDLSAYMEESPKPLVIFLDTYEELVNELLPGNPLQNDLWLRDIKTGIIPRVPYVLWVIAGREKLKWESFFAGWQDGLSQILLGDLSEADSIWYLKTAGIFDAALQKALYQLTGGTPMYLDLCVTQYETLCAMGKVPTAGDFGTDTDSLMENILFYMDNVQKDTVYSLACLSHWDDASILEIMGNTKLPFSPTCYETVKKQTFVLSDGKGRLSMHQTIGEILRQKCPGLIRTQVAQGLLATYQAVVEKKEYFSAAYAEGLERLVQSGMLLHAENAALRLFYREHIQKEMKAWAEAGMCERALGALAPLLACAQVHKKSLLYADMLCMLAQIKRLSGDFAEAKSLIEDSKELYTELLGADSEETLSAKNNLAIILFELGEYTEAKKLFEAVLEQRKCMLGENHPDTVSSMNNLAVTLGEMGENEEAKQLKEQVLEKRKLLLGEDHPDTISAMNNLALTLGALGEHENAKPLQEKVLKKRKIIFGEDHRATISAMMNLANTLGAQGEYDDAKALEKQVLKKRRKLLGKDHPDTLAAMSNLAVTLGALGFYKKAKVLEEMVLKSRVRIYGKTHPHTIRAAGNLAYTLEKLEQFTEAAELRAAYGLN